MDTPAEPTKKTIFVPLESADGETRVAATPETVARFVKLGLAVRVQRGAGLGDPGIQPRAADSRNGRRDGQQLPCRLHR